MKKYILPILISLFGTVYLAGATALPILTPPQGGTGIGTSTGASAGYILTVSSTAPLSYKLSAAPTTFTTTTINGLSSTAYTFTAGTGISIATSAPATITFTNTGVTTSTGNWLGVWQNNSPSDFLSSSTIYVATTTGNWLGTWQSYSPSGFVTNPFTANVNAGNFNLTGINNLTATSATIGTINITSLAQSPLVVGGSATTTIYGNGATSTFGGGISTTGAVVVGTTTVQNGNKLFVNGNAGVNGYIELTSSTQPTPDNLQDIYVHSAPSTGGTIQRLEADTLFTVNGCDVINRDNCVIVKNNQGGNITLGQTVYINGGSGANPTVQLAKADSITTLPVLGLVASTTVANNGFTYVITKGILSNVDTSAFSVGNVLYVSTSTAGGLTNVRPIYPYLVNRVGTVLVSNANNGQILVEVAPFVGGMESGTTASTFNVGGVLAVTTSTFKNYLAMGTDLSSTTSNGVVTINSRALHGIGFNVYNASTTQNGASSTIQKLFYQAVTIQQIDCSTDGANVTLAADERTSSTPQTYGTAVFPDFVCDSNGASTTSFSNATIANNALLNFGITAAANATTTLRVNIRYTND